MTSPSLVHAGTLCLSESSSLYFVVSPLNSLALCHFRVTALASVVQNSLLTGPSKGASFCPAQSSSPMDLFNPNPPLFFLYTVCLFSKALCQTEKHHWDIILKIFLPPFKKACFFQQCNRGASTGIPQAAHGHCFRRPTKQTCSKY